MGRTEETENNVGIWDRDGFLIKLKETKSRKRPSADFFVVLCIALFYTHWEFSF